MEALLTALALGFTAGITPGPLLTLVISTTLERGFAAGVLVSIAPALTDGPIIALCLLLLKDLPSTWLAGITLAGGVFLVWVGIQTIRSAGAEVRIEKSAGGRMRDLRRGILVNLLNPNPWIFWVSVGGPILIDAWRDAAIWAAGFLLIFYGLIVGSKIVLAWLTARGSRFLSGVWYQRALAGSGLVVIGLGAFFLWQGAQRLAG